MSLKRFVAENYKDRLRNSEVVKSISYDQKEIIRWIYILYNDSRSFDLDGTYSKGKFYSGYDEPKIKMDLHPIMKNIIKADSKYIPLKNKSVNSIMFDPPFIIGSTDKGLIKKRFSVFESCADLYNLYYNAIDEFYRVLNGKGLFVFKCQDGATSSSWAHIDIINYATSNGFKLLDLFILLAKSRMIKGTKQTIARKYHSYFLVFRKENK